MKQMLKSVTFNPRVLSTQVCPILHVLHVVIIIGYAILLFITSKDIRPCIIWYYLYSMDMDSVIHFLSTLIYCTQCEDE